MYGIRKGNKHSFIDFGLTIKSKSIGMPSKNKVKETIPFMNGSYDFSALYGRQSYGERTLKYVFNLIGKNKVDMNILKDKVLEWLYEGFQEPLYDDTILGYYFLAECKDTNFEEDGEFGVLTVEFSCYPFKIRDSYEGNILWDDFNFELDMLQETKFNIVESKEVDIYNKSAIPITPVILCSNDMSIVKNNVTYNLKSGTNKDYRFMLGIGNNKMTIKGNGTIEFLFRKEVL